MDENEIRNSLLGELIDKMHTRMADKMFPDAEKKEESAPESSVATEEMPEQDEDISDEDLDAMMSEQVKE